MAIMDGTEVREDLIRLRDGSLVDIDELVEMDPFDLVGNTPKLPSLMGKVSKLVMDRTAMIRIWELRFIDDAPFRAELPNLPVSVSPISKSIRDSVRRVKYMPPNLRKTELKYLFGEWVRELVDLKYPEPCQLSFLYTSYYLDLREFLHTTRKPIELEVKANSQEYDLDYLQDLIRKGYDAFGDDIDLTETISRIKERYSYLGLTPSHDRATFHANLHQFYVSVGELGQVGLREPFGPGEIKASPGQVAGFLAVCNELGNLGSVFDTAQFYRIEEMDRIELLLFMSQHLFSFWEKECQGRTKSTRKWPELFGYLESHQLMGKTEFGDIIDRMIRFRP